ncbi:hypothetical protein ACUSIJ_24755 [Pseudochelatococcus sp. B33]
MSDLDARCFTKRGNTLVPSDVMADEMMAQIKDGRDVLVTLRRARNPKHHRLLFAALRKVVDNTDRWPSEDVLLDELKLATGLAEVRVNLLTGKPYAVPASISFAAMDQTRFGEWFARATIALAQAIGVEHQELLAEIAEMTAPRAPAAPQRSARAA